MPLLTEYHCLIANKQTNRKHGSTLSHRRRVSVAPNKGPCICVCICATLPESTPPSQNIPPFQQLYATLPESTTPSQNITPFQQLYATLPEATLSSENTPLFLTTICPPPLLLSIYPSSPGRVAQYYSCEKGVYSGREGLILGGSHIVVEKEGIVWEGGVDSGWVAHVHLLKKGVYFRKEGWILGASHSVVERGGGCILGGVDSGRDA